MKNVLLPIDVYNDPRKVLSKAMAFLREIEGHFNIFLLKTYLVPTSSSNQVIHDHDNLQNQSLQELQKELKGIKKLSVNGKMTFESLLQMGRPIHAIARIIKERDIDCVILGPAEGLKKEENQNLVTHLHCPVVILPSPI